MTRIFFDNVPASFQSTCVPPRSEASSGDIQRAEARAAPAGGLVTRTRRPPGTRQSAAYRTAARAPFRRSAPSLEGDEERGAARCAKGSKKRPPGSAQRWLFDKVKKRSPVARMERSGMRERLLHSRGLWRVRSRISLRFIRATRIHKPRWHCPPGEAVY